VRDRLQPESSVLKHCALCEGIPEEIKFRKAADAAGSEGCPGVGLGTDFRLESKEITGFALTLNDQILHLSVSARGNGNSRGRNGARMGRFMQRGRNRR